MRTWTKALLVLLAVGAAAPGARAQDPAARPPMERDSLEARVRARMAQVVQRQVGLSDDQMRRLAVTNRRFEGQRRDLVMRERQVRLGLRDELAQPDTARQQQVGRLLDEMLQLQRQRLELIEAEQKELATFMTPIQRARYFGMEEQLRQRMMEMREQGMRRPGAGGPRRPPPGGVRGGVRPPAGGAP